MDFVVLCIVKIINMLFDYLEVILVFKLLGYCWKKFWFDLEVDKSYMCINVNLIFVCFERN